MAFTSDKREFIGKLLAIGKCNIKCKNVAILNKVVNCHINNFVWFVSYRLKMSPITIELRCTNFYLLLLWGFTLRWSVVLEYIIIMRILLISEWMYYYRYKWNWNNCWQWLFVDSERCYLLSAYWNWLVITFNWTIKSFVLFDNLLIYEHKNT